MPMIVQIPIHPIMPPIIPRIGQFLSFDVQRQHRETLSRAAAFLEVPLLAATTKNPGVLEDAKGRIGMKSSLRLP